MYDRVPNEHVLNINHNLKVLGKDVISLYNREWITDSEFLEALIPKIQNTIACNQIEKELEEL